MGACPPLSCPVAFQGSLLPPGQSPPASAPPELMQSCLLTLVPCSLMLSQLLQSPDLRVWRKELQVPDTPGTESRSQGSCEFLLMATSSPSDRWGRGGSTHREAACPVHTVPEQPSVFEVQTGPEITHMINMHHHYLLPTLPSSCLSGYQANRTLV